MFLDGKSLLAWQTTCRFSSKKQAIMWSPNNYTTPNRTDYREINLNLELRT